MEAIYHIIDASPIEVPEVDFAAFAYVWDVVEAHCLSSEPDQAANPRPCGWWAL
jgi:hypothetical protein